VISIRLVPKHSAVRKSSTVKGIKSIFVQSQSAVVENDKVKEYRVNLKLTFEVKD
jgi:flavin-binding protein dodecin